MSETPLTDRAILCKIPILGADTQIVTADFARSLERRLSEAQEKIERVEKERDAAQSFADLWYFVMDEAPMDFERIVTTYSPSRWLQEASKLRSVKSGIRAALTKEAKHG